MDINQPFNETHFVELANHFSEWYFDTNLPIDVKLEIAMTVLIDIEFAYKKGYLVGYGDAQNNCLKMYS
jgi:hypothetical protein